VLRVAKDSDWDQVAPVLEALARAIGARGEILPKDDPDQTREMCEKIWEWEDQDWRTIDHVLAAFTRAGEAVQEARQINGL
jgi:hypothetical protein